MKKIDIWIKSIFESDSKKKEALSFDLKVVKLSIDLMSLGS